jgi:hypothetical protein
MIRIMISLNTAKPQTREGCSLCMDICRKGAAQRGDGELELRIEIFSARSFFAPMKVHRAA